MLTRFEWDAAKAATNLRKHGVSFEVNENDQVVEIIRIISARAADRKERRRYEQESR